MYEYVLVGCLDILVGVWGIFFVRVWVLVGMFCYIVWCLDFFCFVNMNYIFYFILYRNKCIKYIV